ncbi:hypothetical protein ATANTOWER_030541, partial [Ataeniobius toweri]|nr:hypothetical protein [Ataeniobius toweri]
SSCFTADCFMLSIDQKIVNDDITAFSCAICLMFGSYYCFNILPSGTAVNTGVPPEVFLFNKSGKRNKG